MEGATRADLTEPFVRVLELGDFSVSYRVSGLLADGKQIVSARSRLLAKVMDALHAADIEIVSPTFMNQRRISDGERFLSRPVAEASLSSLDKAAVEALMFDKAEAAGDARALARARPDDSGAEEPPSPARSRTPTTKRPTAD